MKWTRISSSRVGCCILWLVQVFNSYGLGYKLTGNADYKEQTLTGAQTLYNIRFDVSLRSPC